MSKLASRSNTLPLRQYLRFLAVGGFVALCTVAFREFLGWMLPSETAGFTISVILAWAAGTVLSYFLQKRITFNAARGKRAVFAKFCVVSALSGAMCALASNLFYLMVHALSPALAHTIAFVLGSLVASLLSFALYRTQVFSED
ncbi:GtrA family protein [Burkholderia sp. F1]|uniref:GtrA family protein n=1 Tax=Burkholderia sp. F1 TaxID=3366817 RepID=UPI003D70A07B